MAVGGDVRFSMSCISERILQREIGVRTRRRRGEMARNAEKRTTAYVCYYNKCLQSCTACVAREAFV